MTVAAPSAPGWLECRANEGAAGAERAPSVLTGGMLAQSLGLVSHLMSGNCTVQDTVSQF